MNWFRRLFSHQPSVANRPAPPPDWNSLKNVLEKSHELSNGLGGEFAGREAALVYEPGLPLTLRLACGADLWCRKRTSVTTMLDPSLFEIYTTGDERLDEDWIVQTNPPSAFKREFTDGCDALLALLQEDAGLHSTRGWMSYRPNGVLLPERAKEVFATLVRVAKTAERELRS